MAMSLKQLQAELTGMEKYTRRTDEELRQQAEGLYRNQYDQDLRALQDAIGQGIAQQNRNAISTGMQRSSYNQAAQASIRNQGIESQRQLASDYESNVANALYQLIAREDEREDNANAQRNQLLMALYEYGRKGSSGGGGSNNNVSDNNVPTGNEQDTNTGLLGNFLAAVNTSAKVATVPNIAKRLEFEATRNPVFASIFKAR